MALHATASAAEQSTALVLENQVTKAMARLNLSPADMLVRHERMWHKNAEKFREDGRLIGHFPLPDAADSLRLALIEQALHSPLDTIDLVFELDTGLIPATLHGLLSGSFQGVAAPELTAATPLGDGLPSWIPQVIAIMQQMEMHLPNASVDETQRNNMSRWMRNSIPEDEIAQARSTFMAYNAIDSDRLRDLAFALVELIRQATLTDHQWPSLTEPRLIEHQGRSIILGTQGDDRYETDAWLLIDPGGNDIYLNNAGGAREQGGVAVLIDLAGHDSYLSQTPFSQGAAHQGVGLLIDLSGEDSYHCATFCQGAALGGIGGLFDFGGQDLMIASQFAQGAAAFGLGLLYADGNQDDEYNLDAQGQGLGRTAGIGLLRDTGGNDSYEINARFKSSYSQWTEGQPLYWSFAQGVGYGFYLRFEGDLADGESGLIIREMFPGGVGLLIDDQGDDSYTASMYAQGAGYFYGLGVLIDRAGQDHYRAGWYGQGAAAHFATGILLDKAGNDSYRGLHQVQGNGRDFSTGVLLDLAGKDRYQAGDRAQGCGDSADGYGIFVDLSGDDHYQSDHRRTRGFATTTDPKRQPTEARPYLDLGIFLDLGGQDSYQGPAGGANQAIWIDLDTERGIGIDDQLLLTPAKPPPESRPPVR